MSIILRAIADNWPIKTVGPMGPARILAREAERDALSRTDPAAAISDDIQRAIALFDCLYTKTVPYLVGFAEGARQSAGGRPNKRVDSAVANMTRATISTPEDAKQAYKALLEAQIASVDKSVVLLQQAADALNEAFDCYYERATPDLFGADRALRRFGEYSGKIISLCSDRHSLDLLSARAREMASPEFTQTRKAAEESAVLLAFSSAIGLSVNLTGTGRAPQREQARLDLLTRWLLDKAGLVARRSLQGTRISTQAINSEDLERWSLMLATAAAGVSKREKSMLLMPASARFLSALGDALRYADYANRNTESIIDALCGSMTLLLACADDCGISEVTLLDEATDLLADMMVA